MTTAVLLIKRVSADWFEEHRIASFSFSKDVYTPYTTLSAVFFPDNGDYTDISEISLKINGITVHHGLADSVEYSERGGISRVKVVSRGFTSLLTQNQLEPGLKTGISFNSLIDGYYTFPYVTHEDNSSDEGYIYVKNGSSIWDGAVNLAYKLCGRYPYIRSTNHVMMNAPEIPIYFTYGQNEITAEGMQCFGRRRISHLHMSDVNDEYGTFELSDDEAVSLNYVRHHFFGLDRQFLYDPQQALEYRLSFSKRAGFGRFCEYNGYKGEDLCDITSFGENVSFAEICGIRINGTAKGITTRITACYDDFHNQ